MSKRFIISDTHFGHANIIKYCERPFASAEEMNEVMIANWNRVVGPDDLVYHLGDFAFARTTTIDEYLDRLNGKISLVLGNHDRKPMFYGKSKVIRVEQIGFIREGSTEIVTCHYPLEEWNGKFHGSLHLHGHCHNNSYRDIPGQRYNVCVENWNYTPIELTSLIAKINSEKRNNP